MERLSRILAAMLLQFGFTLPAFANSLGLAAPFSDSAVLQRDAIVPVWGIAEPGDRITVTLDSATVQTTADGDGSWRVNLYTGPAKASARLAATATRSGTVLLKNIAIGDVWLCAGQSNMEFEASRQSNGPDIVANSEDSDLRLLLVPRQRSRTPVRGFSKPAVWQAARPETVGGFSAVCHAMGQFLRARNPDVPVGLISSSWGGSRIEDWLSKTALLRLGDYDSELAQLAAYSADPELAERRFASDRKQWLDRLAQRPAVGTPVPVGSFRTGWESWNIPSLAKFDGAGIYRFELTVDAATIGRARAVVLGRIDDIDRTTLNGTQIGTTAGWDLHRRYPLQLRQLKPGRNILEVLVVDTGGGGGLYGAEPRGLELNDGTIVPFSGSATFTPLAPLAAIQPVPIAPWNGGEGLATLDHGMIAPLGEYRVKGFAWYQGESNVPRASRYAAQLQALINDWRARLGGQQFLIVQLAAYGPYVSEPSASGWALLREAQRQVALRDPTVRLVPTIDIGDPYDIHPANKREIGRRLALATASERFGPLIFVQRLAGKVTIMLPAPYRLMGGSRTPVGFELCNLQEHCRFVDARLQAPTMIELDALETDSKLRYLWADSALTSLFDLDGIPLPPFEQELPTTLGRN